jgi:acetyl esterase
MPIDPQVRQLLDGFEALEQPPFSEIRPEELRAIFAATSVMNSRPDTPAATEDRRVPGLGGDIAVRVYRPAGDGPWPLVVYFHGGGWVIGDIETHDSLCQHLAVDTPAVVVSVDYRLAPEHRCPAAVEDAEAATRWAAAHAAEMGADPSRLAVAGDSAGGNLAAVVARRARDAGGPAIAFQLLVYPATDLTRSQPSHVENGEGYMLTTEAMEWFIGHYLGDTDPKDPDISPLFATDLAGLPPALVVTAEFDPLRDEGEAYAERLRDAGVAARTSRYDGMIHGFLSMDSLLDGARRALAETIAALRTALAP